MSAEILRESRVDVRLVQEYYDVERLRKESRCLSERETLRDEAKGRGHSIAR